MYIDKFLWKNLKEETLKPYWDLKSLATIIFTSGTTSKPKAAKHSLANHYYSAIASNKNIQLITKVRSNMKNKLMPLMDKILLRKRAIIETINDQLKNISQIEHSRHRSPSNFLINLLSGLIAYCHQKKKPSLRLPKTSLLTC